MRANVRQGSDGRRELVFALERARTRLAVSIASEMKTTRAELWNLYRDTEDRLRRCLKVLRARQRQGAVEEGGATDALEALRRLSLHLLPSETGPGDARQLCRNVREALECLERGPAARTGAQGASGQTDPAP